MATNYPTGNDNQSYMKGAIVGGIIGAAAALLFAPRTGREMRTMLMERAGDACEIVKNQVSELGTTAQSAAKRIGSQTSNIASKIQSFAGSAIESSEEMVDKMENTMNSASNSSQTDSRSPGSSHSTRSEAYGESGTS